VIEAPALRIEPLDPAPLHAALDHVAEYDWVIFTSQSAVTAVWDALRARGTGARALGGARVCAVGPATAAALRERGVVVDVVPERFAAEGVLEALAAGDRGNGAAVRGRRVLMPLAAAARDVLPSGLRALGAQVDVVPVYRTVPDESGGATLAERLARGEVDLVTFTSGSAVRFFVEAMGAERAARAPAATIGPVTSDAARALGLRVAAEAREATVPALVEAVVELLGDSALGTRHSAAGASAARETRTPAAPSAECRVPSPQQTGHDPED
jgi:uroporphyrinogen III methyltransferase/synthase